MRKRTGIKVGLIALFLLCGLCGIAPYLRDLSMALIDERQAAAEFLRLEELPDCAENVIYYYDTNATPILDSLALKGASNLHYTLIAFNATEDCFDQFAILLDTYVDSEDLDMFYRDTTRFAESVELGNLSPLPQDFPTMASYNPNKSVMSYTSRKLGDETMLFIYYDQDEQRVWIFQPLKIWSGGGE